MLAFIAVLLVYKFNMGWPWYAALIATAIAQAAYNAFDKDMGINALLERLQTKVIKTKQLH
jgi:hypothetical protein